MPVSHNSSAEEMLGNNATGAETGSYANLGRACAVCGAVRLMPRVQAHEANRSAGEQRKFRKGLTRGTLAGLMQCKCGHKGARLMVRYLSR